MKFLGYILFLFSNVFSQSKTPAVKKTVAPQDTIYAGYKGGDVALSKYFTDNSTGFGGTEKGEQIKAYFSVIVDTLARTYDTKFIRIGSASGRKISESRIRDIQTVFFNSGNIWNFDKSDKRVDCYTCSKWISKQFKKKKFNSQVFYEVSFDYMSIKVRQLLKQEEIRDLFEKVMATNNREDVIESGPTTVISTENKESEIFVVVEEMPEYPGGNETLQQDLAFAMKHTELTKLVSGKCFAKFTVDKTGAIIDPVILRGINGCSQCDAVALDAIKQLKKFKPGKQNGRVMNVAFTIPIKFN